MKMKDFRKWLEQFDDDVVVEVLKERSEGYMLSTDVVEFDTEEYSDYIDLTNNQFVKDKSKYRYLKSLLLGGR